MKLIEFLFNIFGDFPDESNFSRKPVRCRTKSTSISAYFNKTIWENNYHGFLWLQTSYYTVFNKSLTYKFSNGRT